MFKQLSVCVFRIVLRLKLNDELLCILSHIYYTLAVKALNNGLFIVLVSAL